MRQDQQLAPENTSTAFVFRDVHEPEGAAMDEFRNTLKTFYSDSVYASYSRLNVSLDIYEKFGDESLKQRIAAEKESKKTEDDILKELKESQDDESKNQLDKALKAYSEVAAEGAAKEAFLVSDEKNSKGKNRIFAAFDGERMAGFVMYREIEGIEPKTIYIAQTGVESTMFGKNLAKNLLKNFLAQLHEKEPEGVNVTGITRNFNEITKNWSRFLPMQDNGITPESFGYDSKRYVLILNANSKEAEKALDKIIEATKTRQSQESLGLSSASATNFVASVRSVSDSRQV